MNVINKKYLKLLQKATDVSKKIKELQHECPHEHLLGTYCSNTGNRCRSDDTYWVDFVCEDCGKVWSEDQEHLRYDTKRNAQVTKDGLTFKVKK